ncbi:hypothetical protein [Sulfurimonas sp.]|uniref:hypothetical protein n=1 Tax=Sulfurimonas sp. TaxID=2022749 RepID=UPI002604ABA4|nr:hypothetical protein [Sulfurimonas sp.]
MRNTILSIFVIALAIVWSLPEVAFSKQSILLDSLKQISSIVLAITGAWAAIVYPESLKNIISKKGTYDVDMDSIENLFRPMISSIIILGCIITIELMAFILKLIDLPSYAIPYLRDVSFFTIVYLYILQLWTLVITIIPLNNSYREAKLEHKKNKHFDSATKNVKKIR